MNEQTSLRLGVITPVPLDDTLDRPTLLQQIRGWAGRNKAFMFIVVLPTLLVAAYYFLIAADQYEAEAHFLVHSVDRSPQMPTGISAMLSRGGGAGVAVTEAMSVSDYLSSHDAVASLAGHQQLVDVFRRPEADWLSRLWFAEPTPEKLLDYYRRQVDVHYDTDTGITTLRVRSFRPADSYAVISALLTLGEQRVNMMNRRSFEDAIAVSREQLTKAEGEVEKAQAALTRFRQAKRDIDPPSSGEAQTRLVSGLEASLAAARAQLISMGSMISHSSPQYQAVAARVRALEGQVAAQSGRLAGNEQAIAADLGEYENLRLRQDFAAKRYETAAAALERAREQALKQQLYITRVVEPNLPVKSLYPERWTVVITVLVSLLLVYGLGWLIVAGVREHAA